MLTELHAHVARTRAHRISFSLCAWVGSALPTIERAEMRIGANRERDKRVKRQQEKRKWQRKRDRKQD